MSLGADADADAGACAAVVVHYRGVEDTRECLRALLAAGVPRVHLVDNGGRGEGRDLARGEARVTAHDAGGNRGWAGGCNLGVEAALAGGATAALLVNPDAFVEPGFLAPMLEAARAPGVGLVGGKVLLPGGARLWAAGGRVDRWRAVGVNTGEGRPDGPAYDVPREVSFASGCFLLVRRAVFERIGLLDARYFLYMDDVDLCVRAARAGFRTRYEPRARCVHRVHGAAGGTREEPGLTTTYYLTRNRFVWAADHLPAHVRAAASAWLVATRAAKAAGAALRGRRDLARVILRATRDGLLLRRGPADGAALDA